MVFTDRHTAESGTPASTGSRNTPALAAHTNAPNVCAACGYAFIAAVALLLSCAASHAQSLADSAMQQIRALWQEKAARTGVQHKIGSSLLYAVKQARGEAIASGVAAMPLHLRSDVNQRILTDVSTADESATATSIVQLGGTVEYRSSRYGVIRAWLPAEAIETVAELAAVRAVHPAAELRHRKLTTSEGDVAERAALARATFGVDGHGVKVGVVSDSVDFLSIVQSSGDVGPVTVLPGLSGMNTCGATACTGEGTALSEIVFDLAPGATLLFATADGGDAAMAASIAALRAAGCDVIVDDISYLDEPVFQDGVIAQAVNSVIADGAIYVSAAGNGGNQDDGTSGTWEGDFTPSSMTVPVAGHREPLHDFGAGATLDTVTVQLNPGGLITLQWSDAFGSAGNDYDLFLLNDAGTAVITASTDTQDGNGDPLEAIDTSAI